MSLSRDGRYVAFSSKATNLTSSDTNIGEFTGSDVFLRDRVAGTTEMISLKSSGGQSLGEHRGPLISSTGRYVVFTSDATTLVTGDTNAKDDTFLRDRAMPLTPSVVLDVPTPDSSVFGTQGLTATMLPGFSAAQVDFLVDGAVVASDTTSPFSANWDTTTGGDGNRVLVARATLTGGGTSDSAPVSVRVVNQATCDEKLDVDHQAGKISADEHVRSGIYCMFKPRLLTGRHSSNTPVNDLEAAFFHVMRHWDQASQATRDEVTQFVTDFDGGFYVDGGSASAEGGSPDPELSTNSTVPCQLKRTDHETFIQWCTYTTPLEPQFIISYPFTGDGAVPDVDLNPANGVPDQIDRIENSFRAALAKFTGPSVQQHPDVSSPLGFTPPSFPVRVVLQKMTGASNGVSVAPPEVWPGDTDIYLAPPTNEHSRPRHELFHVIQWQYASDADYFNRFGTGFWMEATAEWALHQARTPDMPGDFVDDYADQLPEFLGDPDVDLLAHASFLDPRDHEYGAFILAEYLEEQFGTDFIRRTWERVGVPDGLGAMETVDDVLRVQEGKPGGMTDILPDFWKRSYFLDNGPTGFADPDLPMWIDLLAGDQRTLGDHASPRPDRQTFAFTGGLTREGTTSVEPGGASFNDFLHDIGRPVTLEIRLRNSRGFLFPPSNEALKATLYSFSQYPSLCRAPVDLSLTNGIASQSVGLGETCRFSTLVLNNADMMGGPLQQKFTVRMSGAPRPGDVFVGLLGGRVGVYRPDGTRVANLLTGTGGPFGLATGETIGVAFDDTGDFYATNFDNASVSKFAPDGTLLGPFGTGYDGGPESIVFDPEGNAFVGHVADGGNIHKRAPDGTLIEELDVAIEDRGADHMALRPGGCTLVYTSEGARVLQYDVCQRLQLPDFATMTPRAFGVGVLPDGGIVVAAQSVIRRFNAQGGQVMTYDVSGTNEWFGLGLDPDGTSFWAGDVKTARVYRFDINTGQVLLTIQTDAPTVSPEGDVGVGGIVIMPDVIGATSPNRIAAAQDGWPQPGETESDVGGVGG